ncbi:MAG: DUF58 domain-containing protein [Gemmataceae bacterium]
MPALPNDVLRQIRRLHLRARRMVRTSLGGEYHSAFKGTGLTFEDVREYQPGDDVRRIDWNVTARMNHPFVKRYVEERELTVLLVVDSSASMRFGLGNQTKRSIAAETAAVLAVCAAGNNDRVGFLSYTDRVERYCPPGKGGRHILRLLRDVLFLEPEGTKTDLSVALEYLNRIHRRRAIVFFLGDFQSGIPETLFRKTARRHDTTAFRITDPREQSWPKVGMVRLEDAETGESTMIDTNAGAFRNALTARAVQRKAAFAELCQQSCADLVELDTNGQHFDAILRYFRSRERRVRNG